MFDKKMYIFYKQRIFKKLLLLDKLIKYYFQNVSNSPADSFRGSGMAWNEYEQGLVLGAFYWCHWCTQIAGGVLAQRFGTKRVFGLSQLATIVLAFLIPVAAQQGYKALIVLRVAQGIANVSVIRQHSF